MTNPKTKNKIISIKSPMNYIGGKYKLLSQLHAFFPNKINNFIDLFCGGLDVSINTPALNKYANDVNNNIINIYIEFQKKTIDEIMDFIQNRIKEFNLTRFNIEGYLQYRDLYNTNLNYRTPLDLFTLSRYSFDNQITFNNNNEYNAGFGFNRSDFNLTQRANTRAMHNAIQNIHFSSLDFRNFNINNFTDSNDFLYVDPPYLISYAKYIKGSRITNNRWEQSDDIDLYNFLDHANDLGLKWALSNVLSHKGIENVTLIEWAEKYNIYDIFSNYSHSTYSKTKSTEPTIEVLVTNYDKDKINTIK